LKIKYGEGVNMLNAVITGVAGQDGSYLSDLLLEKGYRVIGVAKRSGTNIVHRNIGHLGNAKNFILVEGDICDQTLISRILHDYRPHEWYNLAAMSHVGQSFREPMSTFKTDALAVLGQLEMIRQISPYTRFYQASTSELFGGISCPKNGYDESSVFHPRSPYGVSKLAAFWAVKNYREAYGMFACNGILHNHSSPRRGYDFATRKITRGVASVKLGFQKTLKMGNLEAFRDEGHSKDYVRAMWMMLQAQNAKDYLVATHDGATIRQMLEYVCDLADLDPDDVYEMDERYMRPSEVPFLLGNPSSIKKDLGWIPEYSWKDLLKEMYEYDLNNLRFK
jgi:GDPmannose 4,6-dehydratase